MATLAGSLEAKIRARDKHLDGLNAPPAFVLPAYDGLSIANVPTSVAQIFGAQLHRSPLDPAILAPFLPGVRQVVVVIVDALSYQTLRRALASNRGNGLNRLRRAGGRLLPLTSVFPSTTTAALTSLWTGYTPAEHGLVGYQLFLREYGVRANMIAYSPSATQSLGREQLVAAGLDPEAFLPVSTLPETLAGVGVPVFNLLEQPFTRSALGRTQFRGVRETRGIVTAADLWVALRQRMEALRGQRAVLMAYWSAVDTLGHLYGPDSENIVAEVNNLAYSFEREFWDRLSSTARLGVLFLLTADHGMAAVPQDQVVYLHRHPALRDRLMVSYTGDARAAYLHCRQGQVEAVRHYLETRLGDQFCVFESQAALDAGLFGGGPFAAETRNRIGDLIVVARSGASLCDRKKPPEERGRHGGLLAEEMLVPLLVARLDA
jgi:hypothetical protein